jgi:hypothetical protein
VLAILVGVVIVTGTVSLDQIRRIILQGGAKGSRLSDRSQ